jgi:hypothetical protein
MAESQPMDEEWQRILSGIVQRSPPCQLSDVLKGCSILAQVRLLPKELTVSACREHNESLLLPVPLGQDGSVGVVCAAARESQDGNTYTSLQNGGCTFAFDHERQECTAVTPGLPSSATPADAEPFRAAVERELSRYLAAHYPPRGGIAGCAVYASVGQDGNGFILRIVLASRHSRPRGCWAGLWMSQWTASWELQDARQPLLEGSILFMSHYTEDANLHFQRRHKARTSLPAHCSKDPEAFAKEMREAISATEADFHESTEATSVSMGAGPLKAMRRVLPLSKERFDWHPIRHSLVKDIKAAAKDAA